MILWRFIYFCGKFHTDTINQTVFRKEFVKLVWGKWKLFRATLNEKKRKATTATTKIIRRVKLPNTLFQYYDSYSLQAGPWEFRSAGSLRWEISWFYSAYDMKKYFLLIWKAFQNTEEWRFPFLIIFFRFRDIDVFLLCKLVQRWRHIVCF